MGKGLKTMTEITQRAMVRLAGLGGSFATVRRVRNALLGRLGLRWWAITERLQSSLVERLVQPGQTAVDIGANIGYYTLLVAARVGPGGHVYAFEPETDNIALLQRNVARRRLDNVTVVPQAVSSASGPLNLYRSTFHPGDHRTVDPGDGRPRVTISATSLDDYFAARPGPIHFIKVDVQGAEGMVLDGMRQLLDDLHRTGSLTMMVEFWPAGLRRAGTQPSALLEQLVRAGFTLQEINERSYRLDPVEPAALCRRLKDSALDYVNLLCQRQTTRPVTVVTSAPTVAPAATPQTRAP